MAELELVIREAEPQDAKSLIDFLNQVGQESDYMTCLLYTSPSPRDRG